MNRHALEQIPFFVYGTLIPGQPNDYLWRDGIRSVETAVFANGALYDMGYYPMLVEMESGAVRGKLVSVSSRLYKEIVDRIDKLEGYILDQPAKSSFIRIKREVESATGEKVLSWLYAGRQELADSSKRIPGGDWVQYAATIHGDMEKWWENIDTVLGLHDTARGD